MNRLNTIEQIASDLFDIIRDELMMGRLPIVEAPLRFDLLPHDVQRGWFAVARYVQHAFG